MKSAYILLLGVAALAAWFFFRPHEGLPLGKECTVQFRRDALGAARDLPVPPTTDRINGAATSVRGKLVHTDEDWLVLQIGARETWIPKQLVLLIQYHDP